MAEKADRVTLHPTLTEAIQGAKELHDEQASGTEDPLAAPEVHELYTGEFAAYLPASGTGGHEFRRHRSRRKHGYYAGRYRTVEEVRGEQV